MTSAADKNYWPEDQLDYSDHYSIKITKVKFDGEFTHWEADFILPDGSSTMGCTAPTFEGAVDAVFDYLYTEKNEWTKDDANKH